LPVTFESGIIRAARRDVGSAAPGRTAAILAAPLCRLEAGGTARRQQAGQEQSGSELPQSKTAA